MKDTDKKNAKFMEKLLEQKLLADRDDNDWFGKQGAGAPVRDQFGNIITSRKKPTNLNYMSSEWSSPAFNHLKTNEMNLLRNSMPNINQNDISSIIKRTSNELNELNMDNFQQNPQINVYSPTENPTSFNFNKTHQNIDVNPLLDLEAFNKKEQEKAVQNENYQLMEAKRKEKENQKLILKQEADLNDIRLQKEKEEMEARRMFAFGNQNLESRNLYETNFDMGKLMGKTSKVNFAPNRTLRENTQMQFTARTEKSFKRPRTPLEEVERDIRDLQQREEGLKIQKRILQELPFEVSKTVQTTVDIEMQKLKNELNFQQNLLGEQIMGLKGQLLQSNEQRQESEKQVKNLHKEIQKTQLVDEIRQRELYMALILKNRKPTIFHTVTQKLEEAEMHNFHFPEKPKPYYNVYDPSIEDLEFRNKDFHDILINRTEMIQNSVHNEKMVKGSNWNQKSREMERYSYGVELDNESVPNLPDDFSNLQGLTQARIIDDGDQVYYLDTYNANMKRLEAFEDKDARQELARLDGQLFNLLNSVNRGKDTFDDLNQINQYSSRSKNFQINDHNADFYD